MNKLDMKRPIILFDGVCNLCNWLVQFVIKRDPAGKIRFAALQSEAGQLLLARFGLPEDNFDTFVLIENERSYLQSTAALRILRYFKGLWPALFIFILLPRPIRDFIYRKIALNRYRWFGKANQCMMPTAELQRRFL